MEPLLTFHPFLGASYEIFCIDFSAPLFPSFMTIYTLYDWKACIVSSVSGLASRYSALSITRLAMDYSREQIIGLNILQAHAFISMIDMFTFYPFFDFTISLHVDHSYPQLIQYRDKIREYHSQFTETFTALISVSIFTLSMFLVCILVLDLTERPGF